MRRDYLRYTPEQMKSLGYRYPESDWLINYDFEAARAELSDIVKGQFKNIIDAIFTSTDGSLDNVLALQVSEHAPESVKSFIQNVLMCEVQAIQSAPDDETAFRTLIPRSVQTSSELSPYIEDIKSFISESRSRFNAAHQTQPSTPTT